MFSIDKAITYKSRIQQIGDANKFILLDNEVFTTDKGIVLAPRYTYTDNITFINNTFVDIRASHIHDIGCSQRQLITSNLTLFDLMDMGLYYLNDEATLRERKNLEILKKAGRYTGDTDVLVFVCEDIPAEYLNFEEVSFSENNRIFREMLIATGVPKYKANIMGAAVYLNVGWALREPKPMLPKEDVFKKLLVT